MKMHRYIVALLSILFVAPVATAKWSDLWQRAGLGISYSKHQYPYWQRSYFYDEPYHLAYDGWGWNLYNAERLEVLIPFRVGERSFLEAQIGYTSKQNPDYGFSDLSVALGYRVHLNFADRIPYFGLGVRVSKSQDWGDALPSKLSALGIEGIYALGCEYRFGEHVGVSGEARLIRGTFGIWENNKKREVLTTFDIEPSIAIRIYLGTQTPAQE